jgi:hypothetical protein
MLLVAIAVYKYLPIGKQQSNKYFMKQLQIIFMLSFLFSCNHIETGDSLGKSDIEYIEGLKLLDKGEKIYKFYSEFKKKNAGNFFTDRRVATYWIDNRDKEKNEISFAFYTNIKSIDTVYNVGATYSPYMLVTRLDSSHFNVSVNGKKEEIKSFFEDVLKQWQQHR